MKKIRKQWQISIFFKVATVFLAVIIALYAISYAMNKQNTNNTRHEVLNSIMLRVSYYLRSLETDITGIRSRQLEYMRDETLHMLSVADRIFTEYERVKLVNDLFKKVQLMKDSSIYIKEASIHVLPSEISISSSKMYNRFSKDEIETLLEIKNKATSPIIIHNDRLYSILQYPDPLYPGMKEPLFVYVVELSTDEIKEAMKAFSNYNGDGFYLTRPEENWNLSTDSGNNPDAINRAVWTRYSDTLSGETGTIMLGKRNFLLAGDTSQFLDISLRAYIPEDQVMAPLKNNYIWILVLSVISLLAVLISSLSIHRMVYQPVSKLMNSFQKVENGELDIHVSYHGHDEFSSLYRYFNIIVDKFKLLISKAYEEKLLAQNAKLKQLQSQIDPHFLYNSLYLLNRMVRSQDFENASALTNLLGKYYQFITRSSSDEVPLDFEASHARAYINIQTMRFSNRVHVDFAPLPPGCEKLLVPRLILQPVIENAYKYGLSGNPNGGIIKVGITQRDAMLVITVEDNGEALEDNTIAELNSRLRDSSEIEMESTGIINIHRRLQMKFGTESGLFLSRGSMGGLLVEIKIPGVKEQ